MGLPQNIWISQFYIVNMIMLSGIANTPGICLLVADERGSGTTGVCSGLVLEKDNGKLPLEGGKTPG